MLTKWFLFIVKNIEKIKEKIALLSHDNSFLMRSSTLLGFFLLSLIFPIIVFFYSLALNGHESFLNAKMVFLEKKVNKLALLKNNQDRFAREFGSCDIRFLQNNIEPLFLLQDESNLLLKISMQTDYKPYLKRLAFLTAGENKIKLIKKVSRKSLAYEESEWKFDYPVETSLKDVNQILSLIEGVKLGQFLPNLLRPQLIIKKLSLKTKRHGDKVFLLDIDILQRNLLEIK